MDKLSFRRKTCKADYNRLGLDVEFILAETIVNDRPLLEYIEGEHKYNYTLALCLYNELTGAPEAYEFDGWPGKNHAVPLVCRECFLGRCEPLSLEFEETGTEVIWSGYYNYHSKRKFTEIPVFRFEKEHYKAALAQLKKIADEGASVKRT